ncbi:hypothetical protein M9H77_08664 [Catharanthus roseus]|uniref:Uncharacterized protein n=1 Tax=Catharanthus roseus TaxID=4058 RepID=A0ACC0BYQ9_CATRO|nr:hypothetical protein M9H77_08664 [Catharanthus roseus]
MANPFTYELALDVDHMLKWSSSCAYLEKQFLDSVARIKPSYHDLELLHDNLFFNVLVANFSSSCTSMWIRIHIFFGSSVESGYVERVSRLSSFLCNDLHIEYMEKFVKECGYLPSFLDNFVKNHEAFILLNQFLLYVGDYIQVPCDEHEPLVVDETWKTLLLGNFHGFQFNHFHFKEFMWLLFCGKENE